MIRPLLNPEFREHMEPQLLAQGKKESNQRGLQSRVNFLANIALQNFAVNVILIGAMAGGQILFDRIQGSGGYASRVAAP
ncbi:MAG: hypothetical protein KIT83_02765 [Bryobacterales bacterium]|nr:hypothetical protein [Bryobacterales bacterium]